VKDDLADVLWALLGTASPSDALKKAARARQLIARLCAFEESLSDEGGELQLCKMHFIQAAPGDTAKSEWRFLEPVSLDRLSFIDVYKSKTGETIDLTPIVQGAKPDSLLVPLNVLSPKNQRFLESIRTGIRKIFLRKKALKSLTLSMRDLTGDAHKISSTQEYVAFYRVVKAQVAKRP
jgi:hypothetical protein